MRPGCGGFFIGMVCVCSLVVVDQFNVNRIFTVKPKHDAPIGPHGR
jgi:hypothetical protein